METLPIYNAIIADESDGLVCVSIVSEPATEVDYVLFAKNKQNQKFAVVSEEKHLLSSVIMVCDTPIHAAKFFCDILRDSNSSFNTSPG